MPLLSSPAIPYLPIIHSADNVVNHLHTVTAVFKLTLLAL